MILEWAYALASVLLISLVSLIGAVTLSVKMDTLKKILVCLVSFSAGALLGGAFLHLLPEAAESGLGFEVSVYVLAGIMVFFVMEKMVCWRHCHVPTSEDHPHPFAYMNLIGDSVHNLIDGLIIGAAYAANIPLGITTTLAVLFHEIPQEMGDFGVLIHGGFKVRKALFMNFLTALTAVVGTVIALLASGFVDNLTSVLLPFAAGGFIYIAASDLIPELHKQVGMKKAAAQLFFILLGIAVMYSMLLME
ncbi:MAG: ZIP family metal transporter [Candidatus Aenigmatarchaeota archaeon]